MVVNVCRDDAYCSGTHSSKPTDASSEFRRITKDDYDRKLKELKEKQYDINIQIEDHTRADETYYVTASTVLNLAKNALNLFESSEVPEKRALLNYLLQNYVVEGKKPMFTMRSPFDSILSVATQPIGLRG